MAIVLPFWVFTSFVLAQVILYLASLGLRATGVSFKSTNENVLNAVFGVIVYVLTIAIVIGLPWLIKKYKTSREDIGLSRLPSWLDIFLAPAGLIIYLVLSAILIAIASQLSFINLDQVQDTGFSRLELRYEYIVAFLMLVVVAPVAEEILFRGFLFGKLRKHVPIWGAILITSLLFAFAHGAVNVGIDVFALSIVLCLLRLISGTIWPSILLHMLKNSIAFYLLFINPTLLTTLGG